VLSCGTLDLLSRDFWFDMMLSLSVLGSRCADVDGDCSSFGYEHWHNCHIPSFTDDLTGSGQYLECVWI
jgi:hypothetical protein